MTINTNNIRMPAVRMTAGAAAESYNRAASEGQEKVDNVRITLAKSLGIAESELGGGTVAAATQKARDILLNYGNPRSQWDMSSIALDIFAVMNLLQTVGQSLRSAMREMRKMELQVEQASIRSQASMEKDAAITQAIGGGITFLVQVGVTLGGTYNQIKAISKEMTANTAQGIDVAKQQADLALLGDSKEAIGNQVSKLGDSPAVQEKVLDSMFNVAEKNESAQAKLGGSREAFDETLAKAKEQAKSEIPAAEKEVETAKMEQEKALKKLNTAKEELNKAKNLLDGLKEKAGNNPEQQKYVKYLEGGLESFQKDFENANKALGGANDRVTAAEENLNATKAAAEGKFKGLAGAEENGKFRDMPPELEKAQRKLTEAEFQAKGMEDMAKKFGGATVEDVAARCQSDYDALLAKANGERSVNGKISPETAGALKDAGDRLVYARARQIQHYQNQPDGAAKVNALSDRLSTSLQTKLNAANIDKGAMTKVLVYGQMTMQLSQALGKLGESLTNMFAALKHAKATAMQADQKQAEMHIGELSEMLQQMMTTIEKAIEMYQAVVQRDSQTIDEITGAIRS